MPLNNLFFIHTLIYKLRTWASTSQTKFKKYLPSKNMLLELYVMKKEAHARPLLIEIHVLIVYQTNILQVLTFI